MRLTSYLHQGRKSCGIAAEDGMIDLGPHLGRQFPALTARRAVNTLKRAQEPAHRSAHQAFTTRAFRPVIEHPERIRCVGMNYAGKRKAVEQHNPAPSRFVRVAGPQTGGAAPAVKSGHAVEVGDQGELTMIISRADENLSCSAARLLTLSTSGLHYVQP
ncbi:hypothetical protein FJU30_15265 [Affinibrenneria salicis]|uniref:Uncharacterized protein n=1 Tax=Affinibrenneria salicis TaxID=2590031 RepID=A0A5J5FZ32_9GAMM|nr:hypothetical protein [Affinibrenneria salicis]KAA8999030.1 hypothetical protein FJU30_15265 [Affinibrenneria salicis]